MKRLLALLFCLQITILINAQAKFELSELGIFSTKAKGTGQVYFTHPPLFNDILKSKARIAKKEKVWRVRIYMGTGNNAREKAKDVRAGFVAEYPSVEADTEYPSPYFKVLVGAFDTRIEAESFKRKLIKKYPDSRVESGIIDIGSAKEY